MIEDFKLTLESDGKAGTIHIKSLKKLMACLTDEGLNLLQIAGLEKQLRGTKEMVVE